MVIARTKSAMRIRFVDTLDERDYTQYEFLSIRAPCIGLTVKKKHNQWVRKIKRLNRFRPFVQQLKMNFRAILPYLFNGRFHCISLSIAQSIKVRKKSISIILSRFKYGYTAKMFNCLKYQHCCFSTRCVFDTVTRSHV